MTIFLQLLLMLILILIAAQLFSNALEYFGHKVGISSGATGSVFAAIATALPETMVPVLAILAGTADKTVNQEISVGAILGAPLMLSTLSTFLMASSVLSQRGVTGRVKPEVTGYTRDLNFFLGAFFIATIAMFVPIQPIIYRACLSCSLIVLYITYVICTFRASSALVESGHGVNPDDALLFSCLGLKPTAKIITLQLVIGLILLVIGAKGFINNIETAATALGASTLLLSLLVIPIATELPEKVNSILWARKGKDTLAMGNITGAMVFQGTLLPALGILLTPWAPTKIVLTGILMTVISSAWLRLHASKSGVRISALLVNGLIYFIYLFLVLK